MKKRTKYFLAGFGFAVLIAGALISLIIWAWNSPEGTRLLLKTVSYFSPVRIDVGEVQGRLRDDLDLRRVVIRWAEGEIRADRLRLKWEPAELWNRRVVLNELSLEGVVYQDRAPETKKPLFPGWPPAPFWLTKIQGRIDSFSLQELTYRRGQQDPVEFGHLSARAEWDGKALTIPDSTFSGPWGSLQGSMKVGFSTPSLVLDLKGAFVEEHAGMDRLAVKLLLASADKPDEAAGKIQISGQKDNTETLRLESDLRLTAAALNWKNLLFLSPGRKGALRSEGAWHFAVRPVLQARLMIADADLGPELGIATDLFGEMEIEGPMDDYRGRVRMANKAKGWPEASLSGEFRGNLQGVRISNLDASWLDGGVKGILGVSWDGPLALEGRLQGRKLNPARLDPEWAGDLNLAVEGKVVLRENRLSETWVKAKFSESRLQGRTFSGEVDAGLEKEIWRISQLHLRGEGFSLQAKGVPREDVNAEARITDLGKFVAGAQGEIFATGRVRLRESRFSGNLQVEGKNWVLNEIRAGSLTADLRFQDFPGNGQPNFEAKGRLENLQVRSFSVKAVHFETAGSPNDHKAKLALIWEGGEAEGEVKGGYEKEIWNGRITRLTGREALSSWNLQAPAEIQVSPHKILLRPLALKSAKGERIQVEANLGLEPIEGSGRAQWEGLDLSRVNPWLGEGKVSGRSAGAFSVEAQKTGLKMTGEVSLKGSFTRDPFKAEGLSAQARGEWGKKGLSASAVLDLDRGGNLRMLISSAEKPRAEFPQSGKIEAQWKGVDLALLSPILPSSLLLKGQSSGQAAGQWSPGLQVEATGAVKILRSEVTWRGGKKPISMAIQKADLDFAWGGETLNGRLAVFLEEHGGLEGQFELPLAARIEPFFHPAKNVKISLNGKLKENGFLAALYPDLVLKSRGTLDLNFLAAGTWSRPRLKGAVELADAAIQFPSGGKDRQTADGRDLFLLEVSSGTAGMEWGDAGLTSSFNLSFKNHGKVGGKAASPEPAHFSFPRTGQMELSWSDLDLALLKPLGPEELSLEGMGAGQITGSWFPDLRLETAGELKLTKGKIRWRTEGGLISAGMNQGGVDFSWRGEHLRGTLSFSLENYGSLQGNFRLPIPARVPFRMDPAGEVRAAITGQARENGLLAAFLPGTVQESRGNLNLDLRVDGTWGKPKINGRIRLAEAGAFLPPLGIRVEGLSAQLLFQDEQVRIESFQARSGPGNIEGTGVLWLKNWEIQRYEGKIRGDRFQVIYLPDLWMQSSPNLEIQGNLKQLSVRGEVLLPEVLVQSSASPGSIRPSSDVVIVDQPAAKPASHFLDMQVRIILGEKVLVKAGGIDARLEGSLDLKAGGGQSGQTTARGEIRVKEGSYAGYGLRLRIDRGRFLFAGGPVDNPDLDILALRRDEDLERLSNVKVGVVILGNLKRPAVKLYSSPAMKDEDVLSYLLEGRPYDRQSANLSLLVAGAEALLGGDSPGPVDKMRSFIGIDKVDIETQKGELSRSMVTVGKYLTPQLYVSYGYSLFDNQQILKVRYKLSKSWEVEAQRGTAIGVDLYYRIDFF